MTSHRQAERFCGKVLNFLSWLMPWRRTDLSREQRINRARRILGVRGEAAAARLLAAKGLEVVVRNWRWKGGEIDIVALDGIELVFVEVKTRNLPAAKSAVAAAAPQALGVWLSGAQLERIIKSAHAYLRELGRPPLPWRIDLVEIACRRRRVVEVRHWMEISRHRP